MADSGFDFSSIKNKLFDVFNKYKGKTETADCLNLSQFLKLIENCGLTQYKKNIESSIWASQQDKAKKITFAKLAGPVIDNLAADVIAKKQKVTKVPIDHPDVQALANQMRCQIVENGAKDMLPKAPKVDDVTNRLTNAAGYTGSHKERFDAEGKGKGIQGRKDIVENKGYVGNYKGEGTYDKK